MYLFIKKKNPQKRWILTFLQGDDIVTLPDLATDKKVVQDMLSAWIKDLVAEYSIDGLRLDVAKHVSGYLADFQAAGR